MGAAPWGSAEKMTFPFLCLAEGAGSPRKSSQNVLVLAGPRSYYCAATRHIYSY